MKKSLFWTFVGATIVASLIVSVLNIGVQLGIAKLTG